MVPERDRRPESPPPGVLLLPPRQSRRPPERVDVRFRRAGLDARRRHRRVLPPLLRARAARPRLAQRGGAGRVRPHPPLLARPRRRRLPDRRRARALQGAGPARDGRAGAEAALRRLALGTDAARAAPALPPLAAARRRVSRRPDVRRRDRDREPGEDRELRRARPAAPVLQLRAPLRAVGRRAHARDDRPDARRARRRRRSRDLGVREPRRHPAADTLRRRRGRAAAGARCGAAPLRPAGNLVHLPGPGARARGGRPPGRGAPGPGLPPHERRPERARRLPRADPVDEGAAGVRLHRRRALAADAAGLGRGQRRGAGGPSRTRCSSCSARRCDCGRATTASRGARARPGRWSSSAATSSAPSTSTRPELQLPEGEILLASEPGITTTLPPNTAAWIKRGAGQ